MATNQLPATDSAAVLHELAGDDATAVFENDPTFLDSNPAGSSNNLQTPADRRDLQNGPDLNARPAAVDDEDDEDEDEDDEDDDDLDDDDEDDDEEEEDDDEYEDDDDEDDDEDEDDDDEDEDDA